MSTPSLYQALLQAGVKTDNHYSDLYFERTPQSLAILNQYPEQLKIARGFVSNIEKTLWLDVPFAFDPYYEQRSARL